MTVLLSDATTDWHVHGGNCFPAATVNEFVYANDTCIVAIEGGRAELHMQCIAQAGRAYVQSEAQLEFGSCHIRNGSSV